jgi:hypothetical protein
VCSLHVRTSARNSELRNKIITDVGSSTYPVARQEKTRILHWKYRSRSRGPVGRLRCLVHISLEHVERPFEVLSRRRLELEGDWAVGIDAQVAGNEGE